MATATRPAPPLLVLSRLQPPNAGSCWRPTPHSSLRFSVAEGDELLNETAASLHADGDGERARALLREARELLESAPDPGAMVVEWLERAERRSGARPAAQRRSRTN